MKGKSLWVTMGAMVGFVFVVAGCSTLSKIPKGPEGYKVVARSDSSVPPWINGMGQWSREKSNRSAKWFSASSPIENSLQGAKHDAYIRAQRKASDRIDDQNWGLVGNTVKRELNADSQTMMRVREDTRIQIRQASQSWLVGGEEYQYYWLEYQPKHPDQVSPDKRTLYRAWALVRYSIPNWQCSRRNSLKLLPMIASNLGGDFKFKKFDAERFRQVITDITDKNLSLIPENVCTGG